MKSDLVFLQHMLDEINFLQKECKSSTFKDFTDNELLMRAASRSLEIIGEAAKNLSMEFRKTHKSIQWKKIAGLRDKIIHFYFGVDWEIVWNVIQEKLPELKNNIEEILNTPQ